MAGSDSQVPTAELYSGIVGESQGWAFPVNLITGTLHKRHCLYSELLEALVTQSTGPALRVMQRKDLLTALLDSQEL